MAIDNLNYYSAWLPAGQQTDRYSSQPWCLRSKNLDIFSSSKSVKATAWRQPTTISSDIIKQDWKLILKTDWKVYERNGNVDTLVVDPSQNFPVRQVSYTWKSGTYADAQWGTVKDMVVKNVWDEWQAFTVYTDRAAYYYNKTAYILEKSLHDARQNWTWDENLTRWTDDYIWVTHNWAWWAPSGTWISLKVAWHNEFSTIPVRLKCGWTWDISLTITSDSKKIRKYYYDAQMESMVAEDTDTSLDTLVTTSWTLIDWMLIYLPVLSEDVDWKFEITDIHGWSHAGSSFGIDFNHSESCSPATALKDWDFNEYYAYLPIDDNREFKKIWEYYWLPAQSFQILYNWEWSWVEINWQKVVRYEFQQYMWWANPTEMNVIWMMVWNEAIYMIGNMDWNWYIFPCDLSCWRWTPYIAYWCDFKGVTNIDYLMYLVWEDRGISELWVYNGQELVGILWGNQESQYKNLIRTDEQYNFDWKIVEYRDNLILSTTDNRIFEYGQTYGGKWWAFIHELPWSIKELKAEWNNLIVKYTVNSTDYVTALQDDSPFKYYNTEWMAEYPIVLWNHLLEKEESDLFVSYILPSSWCKLEFWGMANHYHFRTFKSSDNYEFNTTDGYYLDWCAGTYELKFIEKNGDQYTFRLEGDLPIQNWSNMKITDDKWVELISYTEYNHFRKIWEITTDKYQEWEFRFHNLNNKLELPKSHSLQIMVRGKGNQTYTPELFALDLVANQRERW